MTEHLSAEKLQELQAAFPVVEEKRPMTRTEKLLRWAELVEKSNVPMVLFHLLERQDGYRLSTTGHPQSAFSLAANDPQLQAEGHGGHSALDAMRFFELSREELHAFSCDCGGSISNADMAKRIRGIARMGGKPAPDVGAALRTVMMVAGGLQVCAIGLLLVRLFA